MTDLTPAREQEIREKREAAKQIVGKKPGRHYARPTITLADIDWLLAALDAERARAEAWIEHDAAVVAYLYRPPDTGGSSELCTCAWRPGWPHADWCGAWLASAARALDAP